MPHSKDIKLFWHKYNESNESVVELITKIDAKTGKHTGQGWKVAYYYRQEEPNHVGFFNGNIDENNEISGSNVTFVYPVFETVLYGQFDNGTMIKAFKGKITAYKCVDGVLDLKIKIKADSPIHFFDPPTTTRLSSNVNRLVFNVANLE